MCITCITVKHMNYSSYTHCDSRPHDWYRCGRRKCVGNYSYSVGRHYSAEYK